MRRKRIQLATIAILALAATVCVLAIPGCAQTESPHRVDLFGGYSHTGNYNIGQSGWIASANYNLTSILGVEADLSGNYGTQDLGGAAAILPNVPNSLHSRMHSFNVGPSGTYRAESGKYNLFGHLLFGTSHTNVSAAGVGDGSTSFSWILGGGADYNFTPKWAARAQLDLLRTDFFSHGNNHGRIGLGIVYRFF
jgi:opacity protein-like surface antigen